MVNPAVNSCQGYDSRIKNNPFSASTNVAARMPLTVQPGSSLLSSQSYTTTVSGDNPQLKTIAILTVLGSAAPAGSFRPPYIGADKRIRWNKSQLKYAKLRSLPPVANTPSLSSVEALFERPWIEQKTNWTGRYMHPAENQPAYGREIAHALAQGLLSLQLNYSAAQKEKLLVRLVQYGIDVYGAAVAGGTWGNDGGHNGGRKMPLLLAATVLGDAGMLAYADANQHFSFQEDQQTWYVTSQDVGRTLYTADGRPREEYIWSDVGIPEWGEKHIGNPSHDGRNWNAYYRDVAGCSTIGHVLTAHLMGLEKQWNWPATFDYYDRFYGIMSPYSAPSANSIQPFVNSMWAAYRRSAPADFTDENVATEIWENTPIASQSGSFTVAFDLMASSNNINGVTGLSNGAADQREDLATIVRFAPSGYIDALNGSAYQAAAAVPYAGGVQYHVVMSVNLSTRRYSVTVTPPGGATVRIADDWKFQGTQSTVSVLNSIGFSATSGYHAVLNIGVETASSTSTPTGQAFANGSFENDLDHWTNSGNVVVRPADGAYPATAGSNLLVFNGGQTAPNGVVSQTFATTPGVAYTLGFDIGVLAYNTKQQRLNVTVQGGRTLVDGTVSLSGVGGGKTKWKTATYSFVADSSSTVLTFKDVSATTDALDLLLDNVRVTGGSNSSIVPDTSVDASADTSIATPTAPAPAGFANGSFENDLDHWGSSGNLAVRAADATYPASAGKQLLVFNGGQAAPNGVVSQTFATTRGVTYTLTFDMGVLAYNTKQQRLNMTVQGGRTLVDITNSLSGISGGRTKWKSVAYSFVADGSTTVLTFKDVSTITDSIDLLLDNVRLTN